MKSKEKRDLREMVDYLVGFYKLDLHLRGVAQKIWFEHNLHKEIIIDFLRLLNVPANVKLIKGETKKTNGPHCVGHIGIPKPCPYFSTQDFRNHRFKITMDPKTYTDFETFVCILIHELSHLVLHSTNNKYRDSEVATDVLVMACGFQLQFLENKRNRADLQGYITNEEMLYVSDYLERLRKRRRLKQAKGLLQKAKVWLS